jgi:hypothetical protein
MLAAHTRAVQTADDALAPEPEGETSFLWVLAQRPA